ncbi:MAG: ATP-binding cassette domain-containing protein, partial [Acidimicrobiia bacterium]
MSRTNNSVSDPVLSVRNLRKSYRSRTRGDVVAVDDVSFEVGQGEIVGLLGPNGAGKTTTIKCICTLVFPTSGRIDVRGVDAVSTPRAAVRNMAAVLEGN